MPDAETEKVPDDYLKTLEEVKKQYQQYVEVSELYTLPIQQKEEIVHYQPPSPDHPLTTNKQILIPTPLPVQQPSPNTS